MGKGTATFRSGDLKLGRDSHVRDGPKVGAEGSDSARGGDLQDPTRADRNVSAVLRAASLKACTTWEASQYSVNIRWISAGSLVRVSASISRTRALTGARSSPAIRRRTSSGGGPALPRPRPSRPDAMRPAPARVVVTTNTPFFVA